VPSIFRALLQRKKAAATEAAPVPAPSFDALYAMANGAVAAQDLPGIFDRLNWRSPAADPIRKRR
jgi:hypothetical protein